MRPAGVAPATRQNSALVPKCFGPNAHRCARNSASQSVRASESSRSSATSRPSASDSDQHRGFADLLNRLDQQQSRDVISHLQEVRPDDVGMVKRYLFQFEDLALLPTKALSLVADRVADGHRGAAAGHARSGQKIVQMADRLLH